MGACGRWPRGSGGGGACAAERDGRVVLLRQRAQAAGVDLIVGFYSMCLHKKIEEGMRESQVREFHLINDVEPRGLRGVVYSRQNGWC